MADIRNCKIFLIKKLPSTRNQEPDVEEIRRFDVNRYCSFADFCTNVEHCLPVLRGQTYSIKWKDEEGDLIVVSSDAEITYALDHSVGPVKLYVLLTQCSNTSNFPNSQGEVHQGVVCDNCEVVPIRGFRYKCMQCTDFDLCGSCEAQGLHSEHPMIRLPAHNTQGVDFNRILKRKFRRHMDRLYMGQCRREATQGSSSSDDEPFIVPMECPFVEKRARHHKEKGDRHHGHHGHGHGHGHGSSHNHEKRKRCYSLLRSAAGVATGAATGAASAAASAATDPANIQYLRNIGQAVARMLDPLGIEVDVDIRDRERQAPTSSQTPTAPAASQTAATNSQSDIEILTPAATNSQPDIEIRTPAAATTVPPNPTGTNDTENRVPPQVNFADLIQAAVQQVPNIAVAVQQITESLAQQHVDSGDAGWTVINNEEKEKTPQPTSESVASAPEAPGNGATPTSVPQVDTERIYPNLTSVPRHPNVLVQQGLENLMAMGFSNEGGILTQLLEIHNGDIYKALDVLQVIRK